MKMKMHSVSPLIKAGPQLWCHFLCHLPETKKKKMSLPHWSADFPKVVAVNKGTLFVMS